MTPTVYNISGSAAINLDGQWYLNEEQVFISEEDSALDILAEKINCIKEKRTAILEEDYSVEQAIKLVKRYHNKVTYNILESCLSLALSKSITNRPDVLDLRKTGTTLADKFIFQIGEELVALSESEIESLKQMSDEQISECTSADILQSLLKETY
jgi:hypothetical protein